MRTSRLYFVNLVFSVLPPSRFFAFKRFLLRWAGANVEDKVRCVSSIKIFTSGKLSIGQDTWIGHQVLITGGDSLIRIGALCDIGPRVCIVSGSHKIGCDGIRAAGPGYSSPISIADGCWIGANATILGGTSIGERSIVAAGSVVKGQFPSDCLIGGTPAKVIKQGVSNTVDKN
jgi:maltose O-acetyltransferase